MLRFETYKMDGVDLNNESTLPLLSSFYSKIKATKTNLDESEGLFIGEGYVNSAFPYKNLDNYNRDLKEKDLPCAILENKYLKATFLTSLGGRLWSLIDKTSGRELVFKNPVLRIGHLAIRNAWFSGGVEFNCGVWGHHPLTCEPLFVAFLTDEDGNQILRMYEFERIRSIVYQMDFSLPKDSKFLICNVRIENINPYPVPIYWWTNIAVPEIKGARIIVPANYTYTHKNDILTKLSVPFRNGIDFTYPMNQKISYDNFWKIEKGDRKYISQIDKEGYGFIQASTDKLIGRKLFVWGQKAGGAKWQEFLSGKDCDGRYYEIQAGITHTQYESLPMEARSVISFTEFFGPIQIDPEKAHSTWDIARKEADRFLEDALPKIKQDEIHEHMQKVALIKAREVVSYGSGWGKLENKRREKEGLKPMASQLDFDYLDSEKQDQWYNLLDKGYFSEQDPKKAPPSYMVQDEWTKMIEKTLEKDNWYSYYQLACTSFARGEYDKAESLVNRSIELNRNPWTLYVASEIEREKGNQDLYANISFESSKLAKEMGILDISISKATSQALYETGKFDILYDFLKSLPQSLAKNPRLKLYLAFAALYTGRCKEAEDIVTADGGLVVPDIKEGELSMSQLWFKIQEEKGIKREDAKLPKVFDFRMD